MQDVQGGWWGTGELTLRSLGGPWAPRVLVQVLCCQPDKLPADSQDLKVGAVACKEALSRVGHAHSGQYSAGQRGYWLWCSA